MSSRVLKNKFNLSQVHNILQYPGFYMCFFTCEMKIAVKKILAIKMVTRQVLLESQAIVDGEGLKTEFA